MGVLYNQPPQDVEVMMQKLSISSNQELVPIQQPHAAHSTMKKEKEKKKKKFKKSKNHSSIRKLIMNLYNNLECISVEDT